MRWRVRRAMRFVRSPDGDPRDVETLDAGVVVLGLRPEELRGLDAAAWRGAVDRAARDDPSQRLVLVSWQGRPRFVCAPRDVIADVVSTATTPTATATASATRTATTIPTPIPTATTTTPIPIPIATPPDPGPLFAPSRRP